MNYSQQKLTKTLVFSFIFDVTIDGQYYFAFRFEKCHFFAYNVTLQILLAETYETKVMIKDKP